MVKPSKKDHQLASKLAAHHSSDGHSTITSPPRALRSNAAVSQIFIASTAASTSTTNLSSPITMPKLPYSTGQTPTVTTNSRNNFTLNSIHHRASDPLKAQLISGASLLSQDFFLKGASPDCHNDHSSIPRPDKNKSSDNNSFDNCDPNVSNRQDNQCSLEHVHSLPINKDNLSGVSQSSIQLEVSNNSSEFSRISNDRGPHDNTTNNNGNRNASTFSIGNDNSMSGAKGVSKNFFDKHPFSRTDSIQNEIATRDLLSNLRSLIFDENMETSEDSNTTSAEQNNNISTIHNNDDCSSREQNSISILQGSVASFKLDDNQNISRASIGPNQGKVKNDKNSAAQSGSNEPPKVSPSTPISSLVDIPESPTMEPTPGPSNYTSNLSTNAHLNSSPVQETIPSTTRANVERKTPDQTEQIPRSSRKTRRSVAQDKRFATISKLPSILSAPDCPQQQLQDINVDLPPNWEARLDAHGRIFYIDHERRTTTWHRPLSTVNLGNSIMKIKVPQSRITEIEVRRKSMGYEDQVLTNNNSTARLDDSTEQQRALLNRRYTLRRTISTRRQSKNLDESIADQNSGDVELLDPVAMKTDNSQAALLNQDTIDGNCMSGSATARAQSYNLCTEQNSRQVTLVPEPSTSSSATNQQTLCDLTQSTSNSCGVMQQSINNCAPSSSQNRGQAIQLSRPKHQLSPSISCPPALKFLNRSDFFNLLHLNDEALMLYNTSTNLKYIINRVRKDKTNSAYERFQHNKDLVAFLNKFTNKDEPLPMGWEVKLDDQGKCFFIDHLRKATTYVDPRLPTEMPLINPRQVPLHSHRGPSSSSTAAASGASIQTSEEGLVSNRPSRQSTESTTSISLGNSSRISQDPSGVATSADLPAQFAAGSFQTISVSYEEKIVAFFKQPHVIDLIKVKRSASGLLNSSLREKINQIRKGGVSVLKKYSHDVNLMMIISLFDVEIDAISLPGSSSSRSHVPQPRSYAGRVNVPGKRDFEDKLRHFYKKLEQKNFGHGPSKLKLSIRRDHILEDAFTKVMSVNSKKDLQRSRLYVSFAGEEGLDYGGPSREFFFLLSRELFNPYYGR